MKFDFYKEINRRETDSMKWDVAENELPMWVADMDFKTAPCIIDALQKRVEHGAFGYSVVPDKWYDAYMNWWKTRHGFNMKKEWLIFCTGIIPAISSIVRRLTSIGDNVIVQTPVYNIFFNSILNNGRHAVECPLKFNSGEYEIDFDELESKLAHPLTTMMILCNPHNPVGKIWDRQTLEKIGELCYKHHVTVLSDEIHCDMTDPGAEYIPFASVSEICRENSVTCISPTKSFSIAGLQTAAVCVPNEVLRNKINRGLNTDEVAEPNAFAVDAVVAAFNNGADWLDQLREYIYNNKITVSRFLEDNLPEIKLVKSNATYLLWLDCGSITDNADDLCRFIRERTGLFLSKGSQYGKGGEQFMRLNIACPKVTLTDGLMRLKSGIKQYIELK